jgi:HEPN domain-containing protein
MGTPASPAGPLPLPVSFPSPDALAQEFFAEAVRHLGDARVLHRARRYPGAITASMKAVELAIKAVLIVDGGRRPNRTPGGTPRLL